MNNALWQLGEKLYPRHTSSNSGLETYRQIATSESISYHRVREAIRKFRDGRNTKTLNNNAIADIPTAIPDDMPADALRGAWSRYLGTSAVISDIAPYTSKYRHIVVIADLHGAPSPEILKAVIAEQPDIIVLAGDLLDMSEAGQWQPEPGGSEPKHTLRQEMATIRAYIEMLLENTNASIKIMRGNHDVRVQRKANELLPPDMLWLFTDPFELLIYNLPRVEIIRTVWQYHYPDGTQRELGESEFMYLLGDALISHANFVGANAGDAVKKLSLWVDKWRETLGLGNIALYVQAHVHKVCLLEQDSGHRVLVEPGAAFEPHIDSYKVNYSPKWSSSCIGCLAFDQEQIGGLGSRWLTRRSSIRLIRPLR